MKKALVACFSASGVTKKVAEKLAAAIQGDLYMITPEVPYTPEDLNWQDKNSRSTVEMNDRSARPAISGTVDDMAQYDVVFVGFPIWWGREPSVVDTFMEAYDFAGKQIVPFATSGSSGMGESGSNLAALAPGAKVDSGSRFAADVSENKLADWAGAWL